MRGSAPLAVIAGFAAGIAAAVVTVVVAASSGAFDGSTTVVQSSLPTITSQPVTITPGGHGLDAGALYRSRIAGVVTIAAVFPTGEAGGSGFVVSSDGLIMTNAHVVTNSADSGVQPQDVKPADHVYVRFSDGDQVDASIVGYDLFADVAVLRVTDPNVKLSPVPLGNSSQVKVGEPVAAIGSPFLEAGSLSVGVVSAINRSLASPTAFQIPGAIQTDAAINHGNSGGPLFDAAGHVIGINAQIQSTSGGGEGVGFAVPIDLARRSMKQLVETGHVAYGWLGVRLGTITPAVADQFHLSVSQGALIEDVTPGGPAQQAGLTVGETVEHFQDGSLRPDGDVIVQVDGRAVTSSDQFVRLVSTRSPGEVLHLKVVRGGKTRMVDVKLGVRPL
jgi:S1-C subfamily serine protease